MNHILIICRGISGSGKSTLVAEICLKINIKAFLSVFSTDHYWCRPDGYYDFNPKRIKEAHQWNLERYTSFAELYSNYLTVAIIDNTNTTFQEFEKYIQVASKYNSSICVVEPQTEWKFDVDVLTQKNTHGVPREGIERMLARWESHEKVVDCIADDYDIDVITLERVYELCCSGRYC